VRPPTPSGVGSSRSTPRPRVGPSPWGPLPGTRDGASERGTGPCRFPRRRPLGPLGARGGRRRGRPLPFGPSAPQGGPSEGLRRAGGPSPRAAPSDAALGVRGRPRPWGGGMRRALARPRGVGVPSGSRACRGRGRGAPPSARVAAEGGPRGGVRRRRIPVVPPMSCPPREDRGVSPGAATLAARIGSPGAPPGRPASRPDPVHGLACAPGPVARRDGARGTAPGARRAPLARGGRLPTPEGPVNLTPAGPLDGRRPPPWHGHADPPEGPVGALGPRTSRTPRPPPTPSRPSGRDGGAGCLEASTPPPRVRRDARWGLRVLGGAADPRGSNGAARRRVGALKCGSGAPSPPSTS